MTMPRTEDSLRYDRRIEAEGRDSLAEIAKLIQPSSTVLDLGTSSGALGRYLTAEKACTVDGVELDRSAAERAKPHYRRLLSLDLDSARLDSHFPASTYDAIVCADVLEHLKNPGVVLDQLEPLLSAAGRVLVSIPNVGYAGIVAGLFAGDFRYRPTGLLDSTHLRFFTRSGLLELLAKHGFHARSIRPIVADLRESEFRDTHLDALSPAVLRALLAQPDALTYQFIVEALPGPGIGPAAAVAAGPQPLHFGMQLYWSDGDRFTEHCSVRASALVGGARQTVELKLPALQAATSTLRLDVADRPGYLRVASIVLRNSQSEVLWSWDGRFESLRSPRQLAAFGDTWLSSGDDPSVELPVPPSVLANLSKESVLSIDLDWPMSGDYRHAAQLLDDHERRWASERDLLLRRLEQLEQENKEAEAKAVIRTDQRLKEATREVSERVERLLASLQREIELLRAGQDHARANLRQLSSRMAGQQRLPLTLALRREIAPTRFEFDPIAQHEVRALGGGKFESTGTDPHFELRSRKTRFPVGWVDLEFAVRSETTSSSSPHLYLDFGLGYDEAGTIQLPHPKDGFIRAEIWLPPGVTKLRFDPIDRAGSVQLGILSMRELGKIRTGLRFGGPLARRMLREPRQLPAAARDAWALYRGGGLRALKHALIEQARPKQAQGTYLEWVARYDALAPADRKAIRSRIESLAERPRFSIVMPVFNAPEQWLRRAIESVLDQLYPDWELCIADDASPQGHVRRILAEYAARDSRIRVAFRKDNGHISAASNSALELATGDWVVLLDHDDELAPHALYMLAEELAAHPDADLIYSDEDKLDEAGNRYDPYFKPDFNVELLWSHNFFSHLGAYRASLLRAIGGFRRGFEGSQDYDLVLRALRQTDVARVRHIPHVLYHWRSIEGSAASSVEAKPYATLAARRALQEHLDATQPGGRVEEGRFPGTHRVTLPLPASPPLVSILIPTRDSLAMLRRCVDSIRARTTYPRYEIIIVDNQSSDPAALEWLRSIDRDGTARVLRYDKPFNYSAINNFAAREAKGSVLCLLNNDVEIIAPEWLSEMVSHAVRKGVGAVGARLLYPDGRVQHAGVVGGVYTIAAHVFKGIPREAPGYFGTAHLLRASSIVTAACLVVRRELYEEVGGLDAVDLAVAFNDTDFCLRLQARGYRNLYTPWAELYHFESYSRGDDLAPEKRARFEREIRTMLGRWPALAQDPFYNPNLTLCSNQLEPAFPPRAPRPWRLQA